MKDSCATSAGRVAEMPRDVEVLHRMLECRETELKLARDEAAELRSSLVRLEHELQQAKSEQEVLRKQVAAQDSTNQNTHGDENEGQANCKESAPNVKVETDTDSKRRHKKKKAPSHTSQALPISPPEEPTAGKPADDDPAAESTTMSTAAKMRELETNTTVKATTNQAAQAAVGKLSAKEQRIRSEVQAREEEQRRRAQEERDEEERVRQEEERAREQQRLEDEEREARKAKEQADAEEKARLRAEKVAERKRRAEDEEQRLAKEKEVFSAEDFAALQLMRAEMKPQEPEEPEEEESPGEDADEDEILDKEIARVQKETKELDSKNKTGNIMNMLLMQEGIPACPEGLSEKLQKAQKEKKRAALKEKLQVRRELANVVGSSGRRGHR